MGEVVKWWVEDPTGTTAVFTVNPVVTIVTVPAFKFLGFLKSVKANFTRPGPGGDVRGTPVKSV